MIGTTVNRVWTPETKKLLRDLWTEGLSASQIADQIPGATRNAVIGAKHRMGLESRKQAPSVNPRRIVAKKERNMSEFKPLPVFTPPEALNGPGIPFMKANSTTCRSVEGYEVNSKGHNLALFCPNPKTLEASFCAFHQGVYYRKDYR